MAGRSVCIRRHKMKGAAAQTRRLEATTLRRAGLQQRTCAHSIEARSDRRRRQRGQGGVGGVGEEQKDRPAGKKIEEQGRAGERGGGKGGQTELRTPHAAM
jgi:hypothetical protein